MYRWVRSYMDDVLLLLQFLHANRDGDWGLYLATLEKLCALFFAYDRLDYARHIPEYLARMQHIRDTDPVPWNEFSEGAFTVNTSNRIPFTRLGVDQAIEHLNKTAK